MSTAEIIGHDIGRRDTILRNIVLRNIILRINVSILGTGEGNLVPGHGVGCDQNMWRFRTPLSSDRFRIVLFDDVGSGKPDASAHGVRKNAPLDGYAQDIICICDALKLRKVTLVGHSVSVMIGLMALIEAPQFFLALVMVCPSPDFLNVPQGYLGGFEREDLEEPIDKNDIGWANYLSPLVTGTHNGTRMIEEPANSFCSNDPEFAKAFARASFLADSRPLPARAKHPVLVFQSSADAPASISVAECVVAARPATECLDLH